MKNVQVIDGADNSTFAIFQVDEADFVSVFPNETDIAFAEDCDDLNDSVFERMWSNPVDKKLVMGIHGTLLIGLQNRKAYFPTRREDEAKSGCEGSTAVQSTIVDPPGVSKQEGGET